MVTMSILIRAVPFFCSRSACRLSRRRFSNSTALVHVSRPSGGSTTIRAPRDVDLHADRRDQRNQHLAARSGDDQAAQSIVPSTRRHRRRPARRRCRPRRSQSGRGGKTCPRAAAASSPPALAAPRRRSASASFIVSMPSSAITGRPCETCTARIAPRPSRAGPTMQHWRPAKRSSGKSVSGLTITCAAMSVAAPPDRPAPGRPHSSMDHLAIRGLGFGHRTRHFGSAAIAEPR